MSEPTATAPPPEPAEEVVVLAHDGPAFVHNGIIRFPMGADTVRVRRPFLGELRSLRLALQDVQDQIAERSRSTGAVGIEYQRRAQENAQQLREGKISPEEHAELSAALGAEDARTARELDDWREQVMLDWWRDHVFAPLALDPVPDQLGWPMWILDRTLPGKCLQHWRTVPTGPG